MIALSYHGYPEAIADFGEVLKAYRGPEALYGRGLARIRSGDSASGKADKHGNRG